VIIWGKASRCLLPGNYQVDSEAAHQESVLLFILWGAVLVVMVIAREPLFLQTISQVSRGLLGKALPPDFLPAEKQDYEP